MVARGGSPTQRKGVLSFDPRAYLKRRQTEAEEEEEEGATSEGTGGSAAEARRLAGKMKDVSSSRINKARLVVWTTMEDPSSSMFANVISSSMMTIIVVSIGNFTFGSFPDDFCRWEHAYSSSQTPARLCSSTRIEESASAQYLEMFCIMCFTVEYLTRLLSCGVVMPAWRFVLDPLNLLDLIAILPWYVTQILTLLMSSENGMAKMLGIVRIVRLTRILRVFKASKSMKMMLVLARTMHRSSMALSVLLIAVIGMMLFFGAVVVQVERGQYNAHPEVQAYMRPSGVQTPFYSIPQAMYWCMATMTTVGYGDLYPETGSGQVIGYFTILLGIVVLSLPITVIGSTFSEEFEEQNRIEERERRLRQLHLQERLDNGEPPPPPTSMLGRAKSFASGRLPLGGKSEGASGSDPSSTANSERLSGRRPSGVFSPPKRQKSSKSKMVPGFVQSEWLLEDYRASCSQDIKQYILRSETDLLRMTRKAIVQSRCCVQSIEANKKHQLTLAKAALDAYKSANDAAQSAVSPVGGGMRSLFGGGTCTSSTRGSSGAQASSLAPVPATPKRREAAAVSASSSSSSAAAGPAASLEEMRAEPVTPPPDAGHAAPAPVQLAPAGARPPDGAQASAPTPVQVSAPPTGFGTDGAEGAAPGSAPYADEPVMMAGVPSFGSEGSEAAAPPTDATPAPAAADEAAT